MVLLSYHPAPGYRDFGRAGYEGVARRIGNYGYCWSSAVSGTHGVFLHFNTQSLYPGNTDSRDYGFQLRCLSE